MATFAHQYFGDKINPLVYVDDVLAAVGNLPDSRILHTMAQNPDPIGIIEQDILVAAKKRDISEEE